jgi:hypothetical protein
VQEIVIRLDVAGTARQHEAVDRGTGFCAANCVAGANAAANLYSLIETCKANSVEPYGYLVALFKALPLAHSADDYEALLPWRVAASTD